MSDSLEFAGGDSAHNKTRNGAPRKWAWAKDDRGPVAAYKGYYKQKDFFSVIWQVNLPKEGQDTLSNWTHGVRLQVESPVRAVDRKLNDLKLEVVRAILDSNIEEIVRAKFGYDSKRLRTSDEAIRENRTTTLFRVVLNDKQSSLPPDDKIKTVHKVVGSKVEEIISQFYERLEKRFPLK